MERVANPLSTFSLPGNQEAEKGLETGNLALLPLRAGGPHLLELLQVGVEAVGEDPAHLGALHGLGIGLAEGELSIEGPPFHDLPLLLQKGFDDFGRRFKPIMDAFEEADVYFALECHPTEIAFDIVSAERAIAALDGHPRFGFNYDPSHFGYQGVDYVKFIRAFADRINHVHMKDVWWDHGDGTVGVFGGHTDFCDARRFWDFRSVGRGDIDFEEIIVALNDIGYGGPLSVEWEDGRMERFHGAAESCEYVKALDFPRNEASMFDAAFDSDNQ